MNKPQLVRHLHDTYIARTGLEIVLNMARERLWADWLTWSSDTWTPDDLTLTIRYLKTEIAKGNRNEGALKYSNLIGNPERFEEDLALAKKEHRHDPYQRRRSHTHTPAPASPTSSKTTASNAKNWTRDETLRHAIKQLIRLTKLELQHNPTLTPTAALDQLKTDLLELLP